MHRSKNQQRVRRHNRLRKGVVGTTERPRLQIHRTLHHLYAFVVDDSKGHTLVSASTRDGALAEGLGSRTNIDAAKKSAKRSDSARRLPASPAWCSTGPACAITAASRRSPTQPAKPASSFKVKG